MVRGFITKNVGAKNKYFKNQYTKWTRFDLGKLNTNAG